jgi:hypothetical protein
MTLWQRKETKLDDYPCWLEIISPWKKFQASTNPNLFCRWCIISIDIMLTEQNE